MDLNKFLNEVTQLARAALDSADLAQRVALVLQERLEGVQTVAIRHRDDEFLTFLAGAGNLSQQSRQGKIAVARFSMLGVEQYQLPLSPTELDDEQREALGPLPHSDATLLYVPLRVGGKLEGSICVTRAAGQEFVPDEVAAAEVIGTVLAGSLATARRISRLQGEQRRSRGLIDVMTAASRAQGLNDTLREICVIVSAQSVADRCSIFLFNEDEQRLVPVMSQGVTSRELWKQFRASTTHSLDPAIWSDAIVHRRPLIASRAIEIAPHDAAWRHWVETFSLKSLAFFPLHAGDRFVGTMSVDAFREEVDFSSAEREFLLGIATQAGVLIEKALLQEELKEQAIRDPLTGLYNRRFLEERLEEEISRSARSGDNLALLVIDVDQLKEVNDRHGHLAGDAVLKCIGGVIRSECRKSDIVGRLGGDEFLAILPATDKETADNLVRRVLGQLHGHCVDIGGDDVSPMASVGVASFPADGEDAKRLFASADADLYRRKPLKSLLPERAEWEPPVIFVSE